MSLVAYVTSDDSDQSDSDEQEAQGNTAKITSKRTVENNDDSREHIPRPTQDQPVLVKSFAHSEPSDSSKENNSQDIEVLLKELPVPKSSTNDNSYSNVEEEELEDEVKPKSSQLVDAPKPPPKKKQPVKITIPALDQDSDEDEPASKKRKTPATSGRSGLTSLLPAPVHLSVKETNRVLLPYSLTKKQSPAVNPVPSSRKDSKTAKKDVSSKGETMLIQGLASYDSDSEEEDDSSASNFFSLDNGQKEVEPMLPELPQISNSLKKLNLPAPMTASVSESEIKSDLSESSLQNKESLDKLSNENEHLAEALTNSSSNQDEPLQFKSSFNKPLYYSQTQSSYFSQQNVQYQNDDNSENVDTEKYQYPQYEEHEIHENPEQRLMLDEEFLRLQGKKQRGREPINIVDVNADDFIGEVDLMKNITVETEHVSSKKKDGPTSQQKRKHQITYLAHQAKEREMELKNQWSQNRVTKKQTQAKYGF